MKGKNFYKDIKPLKIPLPRLFDEKHFSELPEDWFIVIADIKNSSTAVAEGRHNDVNLVAAASLVVVLNIAKAHKIEIPFFFGGDGGTCIVPMEILNEVLTGLALHNNNSIKNFNIEMYIGHLAIADVYHSGHFIKIAKVNIGGGFNRSVVVGDGLKFAEQMIKQSSKNPSRKTEALGELNLKGLECRWDRIKPPGEENEIVCYLVSSVDPLKQLQVFRDVFLKIEELYGDLQMRHPLSPDRLKLLLTFEKIKKEMMAKYGRWKLLYFIKTYLKTFVGKFYFKYNWTVNDLSGNDYIKQLISNADTLTIDGRINTVISGKMDKRLQLVNYLSEQESKGNLIFGHHISKECVMTCYISKRNEEHIHFVDGAEGGYTEAAKEFKMKISRFKDLV